jgi:hypothetical protein
MCYQDNEPQPPLSDFYPLAELPDHLPRRRGGKRVDKCIGYRWAKRGRNGVRLRTINLLGLCTCDAYVREFAERTGVALPPAPVAPGRRPAPTRPAAQARRGGEAAAREMEEAGCG